MGSTEAIDQAVAMLIDQGNEQKGILFPLGWLGLVNISRCRPACFWQLWLQGSFGGQFIEYSSICLGLQHCRLARIKSQVGKDVTAAWSNVHGLGLGTHFIPLFKLEFTGDLPYQ